MEPLAVVFNVAPLPYDAILVGWARWACSRFRVHAAGWRLTFDVVETPAEQVAMQMRVAGLVPLLPQGLLVTVPIVTSQL